MLKRNYFRIFTILLLCSIIQVCFGQNLAELFRFDKPRSILVNKDNCLDKVKWAVENKSNEHVNWIYAEVSVYDTDLTLIFRKKVHISLFLGAKEAGVAEYSFYNKICDVGSRLTIKVNPIKITNSLKDFIDE